MEHDSRQQMKFEDNSDGNEGYKAVRFAQLYADNERYLRAFAYSIIPNWDSVDEIVQQASLVMWRKFDSLRSDTEFLKWAYTVTRYEILAFKRTKARNRIYFDSDLVGQLAEEFERDAERMKARNDALVSCYASLSDYDHGIAVYIFTSGMKILDVAKMMGVEQSTFYKTVRRIRNRLMRCVEQKLKDEE